jgi:hypothetical protein
VEKGASACETAGMGEKIPRLAQRLNKACKGRR